MPGEWAELNFGGLQMFFGQQLNATIVALRHGKSLGDVLNVNPAWTDMVSRGDVIYYMANQRLSVPWSRASR